MTALEHVRAIRDARKRQLEYADRMVRRQADVTAASNDDYDALDMARFRRDQAEIELHQAELLVLQWEAAQAQAGATLAQQMAQLRPRHGG